MLGIRLSPTSLQPDNRGRIHFRIAEQVIPELFIDDHGFGDYPHSWEYLFPTRPLRLEGNVFPGRIKISSQSCPELNLHDGSIKTLYVRGDDVQQDNMILRCPADFYQVLIQHLEEFNNYLRDNYQDEHRETLEEEFFGRLK